MAHETAASATDTAVIVAENVYRHRKAAGIAQEKLAWRAGLSRETVRTIERGFHDPARAVSMTLDTLTAIAAALGVQPYRMLLPYDGGTRAKRHGSSRASFQPRRFTTVK